MATLDGGGGSGRAGGWRPARHDGHVGVGGLWRGGWWHRRRSGFTRRKGPSPHPPATRRRSRPLLRHGSRGVGAVLGADGMPVVARQVSDAGVLDGAWGVRGGAQGVVGSAGVVLGGRGLFRPVVPPTRTNPDAAVMATSGRGRVGAAASNGGAELTSAACNGVEAAGALAAGGGGRGGDGGEDGGWGWLGGALYRTGAHAPRWRTWLAETAALRVFPAARRGCRWGGAWKAARQMPSATGRGWWWVARATVVLLERALGPLQVMLPVCG